MAEIVLKLFEILGLDPKNFQLSDNGKIVPADHSLNIKGLPRVVRGSGKYKLVADPNATRGMSQSGQGNGQREDGN